MRTLCSFENWPCICLFVVSLAGAAFSQTSPTMEQTPANELVRATVSNELNVQAASESHWMYHVEQKEQGKALEKDVIQTAHGSIEKLASIDAHPLSSKQKAEETKRIQGLVKDVAEQQRIERFKEKESQQCEELFKLIPDAFIFIYAGATQGLVKLTYQSNPGFRPPTRMARVFQELTGEMWIDAKQHRLVRMRGQLIADVKFGGGLLGYLQKGGHFDVEQREVSPGQWQLASLVVDMQGKALLLKAITVHQNERRTNFRKVPETLRLSDAAEMLTNQVIMASN